MSASVTKLKALWDDVRNDAKPLRWVIAKGNDASTDLDVAASGESGLSGLVAELEKQSGVLFGGIRVAAIDERGTVTSIRPKFIKFMLITGDVSPIKRAKAANLQRLGDDIFHPTHSSFNIYEPADLSPFEIQRKLHASAGAHLPNRYEFEGREEADSGSSHRAHVITSTDSDPATPTSPPASPASPQTQRKQENEIEKARAAPAVVAATPAPVAAAAAPPAKAAAPSPATTAAKAPAPAAAKAVSVPASGSVAEAWAQVQSDKAAPNYIVISCDGKNESSAKIESLASGNLAAFKECFDDEKVMCGAFRLRAIDDRGTVLSIRTKYVFVYYIGSHVKPMVRAQAGQLRSKFESIFSGCHLNLPVTDMDDLQEADLTTKLLACGGAHSPNKFDYSGNKDINKE